jgi:hypothetical protein
LMLISVLCFVLQLTTSSCIPVLKEFVEMHCEFI